MNTSWLEHYRSTYYELLSPEVSGAKRLIVEGIYKRAIGYDKIDYLLSQSNSANPNSIKKVILRAKFDLGPSVTTCDWSYTPNSFKVQIVLPDTISVAEKLRYTSLSFVDLVDSNSVRLRGTDNISPLFYDPEL
jgi:hypothetical protein